MEAGALPRVSVGPALPAIPARPRLLSSDQHLVGLIREGQSGAFEALYDRHHRAILSFCRHMLSDPHEAEDAVQHTFMAAYRELAYTTKDINVRPWLFTIARNRCYSILRSRREQPTDEFDVIATEGLAAEVQIREDLRDLLADMSELPESQRAALVLSELDAMTHAEIGDVLGVRAEKVKALVYQARSTLVASKTARETPCAEIRLELAEGRGAALRRANLRRHLRDCDGCRQFRNDVERQRRQIRIILPVVPSLALKELIVGAAVVGGGGAAVGGGAVLSGAVKGGLLKAVFAAIAVSAGTAGTAIVIATGALPMGTLLKGFQRTGPQATPTVDRHGRVLSAGVPASGGAAAITAVASTHGGRAAARSGALGQFTVSAPRVSIVNGRLRVNRHVKVTTSGLPPLAPVIETSGSLPPLAPGTASAAAGSTSSPAGAGVSSTAAVTAPAAASPTASSPSSAATSAASAGSTPSSTAANPVGSGVLAPAVSSANTASTANTASSANTASVSTASADSNGSSTDSSASTGSSHYGYGYGSGLGSTGHGSTSDSGTRSGSSGLDHTSHGGTTSASSSSQGSSLSSTATSSTTSTVGTTSTVAGSSASSTSTVAGSHASTTSSTPTVSTSTAPTYTHTTPTSSTTYGYGHGYGSGAGGGRNSGGHTSTTPSRSAGTASTPASPPTSTTVAPTASTPAPPSSGSGSGYGSGSGSGSGSGYGSGYGYGSGSGYGSGYGSGSGSGPGSGYGSGDGSGHGGHGH